MAIGVLDSKLETGCVGSRDLRAKNRGTKVEGEMALVVGCWREMTLTVEKAQTLRLSKRRTLWRLEASSPVHCSEPQEKGQIR